MMHIFNWLQVAKILATGVCHWTNNLQKYRFNFGFLVYFMAVIVRVRSKRRQNMTSGEDRSLHSGPVICCNWLGVTRGSTRHFSVQNLDSRYLSQVWVKSHLSESNLSKKGPPKCAYLRHILFCDKSAELFHKSMKKKNSDNPFLT